MQTKHRQQACKALLLCLLSVSTATAAADDPAQITCHVSSFGATADGQTYNTLAIQKAIDSCAKQASQDSVGIVVFEDGRQYLSGTIKLASRVRLRIPKGTTLLAGDQRKAYGAEESTWYLVLADGCTSCGIEGEGTIDGQADKWVVKSSSGGGKTLRSFCPPPQECLPRLIGIRNSMQVSIDGVRIVNAVHGAVHVVNSDAVAIMGVSVSSPMDLEHSGGLLVDGAKRMYIASVEIETGGDALHVQTLSDTVCESMLVENSVLQSRNSAIRVGDANKALIETLVFRNLVIHESRSGVAVQLRDGGGMRDLQFVNITLATRLFTDVSEQATEPAGPVSVTVYPRMAGAPVGALSNITFRNLSISAEAGLVVAGVHKSSIDALVLDTIRLDLEQSTDFRGGRIQPAQEDQRASIEVVPAVYLAHVNHATLQQVTVVFGDPARPEWGSSLELAPRTVHSLAVQGLMAHDESAHPYQAGESADDAERKSRLLDWTKAMQRQHQQGSMSLQENAAMGVEGRKAASSASALLMLLTAFVIVVVVFSGAHPKHLPARLLLRTRRGAK